MAYASMLALMFSTLLVLSSSSLPGKKVALDAMFDGTPRGQSLKGSAGSHSRGQGKTAGETRINAKDGLTYVWIPAGTFRMGCSPGDHQCRDREPGYRPGPWEEPHTVTLTRGFWMGQTLVTHEAYKRVMRVHGLYPDRFYPEKGLPEVKDMWKDANAYCTAVGMRLPTEAEWEYAARAGTTEARYGDVDAIAWYKGNSGGHTHPVAQKRPNAWKLYDMLGNVREWTNDWFEENYFLHSPAQDPQGPPTGDSKVIRGTSYLWEAYTVRATNRIINGDSVIGFRCAGELP